MIKITVVHTKIRYDRDLNLITIYPNKYLTPQLLLNNMKPVEQTVQPTQWRCSQSDFNRTIRENTASVVVISSS